VQLLHAVLTDTLLHHYLRAYSAPSAAALVAPFAVDADLHAAGHAVMRLACIAQARFVA
jgi:hypothetical protein